jgi:hypothetical protein
MANAYVVPFNFNPYSVEIKTGAYTIPAGYYARARPTNLETDFTIDAVIAVEKTKYIGSTTSTTVFTNSSCYPLAGGASAQGNYSFFATHPSWSVANLAYVIGNPMALSSASSNTAANVQATPCGLYLPTDCILLSAGGGDSKYFAFDAVGVVAPDWFFVPTDTDLNGSRYTVELYPIPT